MLNLNFLIRYGAGNSKFYTTTDAKSHNAIQRLPSVKKLNELDQTLYLSKSTFFNDTKPPHNVVGIPIVASSSSPPPPLSTQILKGKTTIIPIKVEGRDDLVTPDLIQFDSMEQLHQQQQQSATNASRTSSANLSNGLTRCFPSLPSPPSETLSYPISDQVDGRLNRYSYDVATKCRSSNCNFFGSPKNGYCSKCTQQQNQQQQQHQQQQYRKIQTEI